MYMMTILYFGIGFVVALAAHTREPTDAEIVYINNLVKSYESAGSSLLAGFSFERGSYLYLTTFRLLTLAAVLIWPLILLRALVRWLRK
jgi:hypothetical protein